MQMQINDRKSEKWASIYAPLRGPLQRPTDFFKNAENSQEIGNDPGN